MSVCLSVSAIRRIFFISVEESGYCECYVEGWFGRLALEADVYVLPDDVMTYVLT